MQLMQAGGTGYLQVREAVLEGLGLDCGAAQAAAGELKGRTLRDLQASGSEHQQHAALKAQQSLMAFIGQRLISNETVRHKAVVAHVCCNSPQSFAGQATFSCEQDIDVQCKAICATNSAIAQALRAHFGGDASLLEILHRNPNALHDLDSGAIVWPLFSSSAGW